MSKKVGQIRYYGNGDSRNYPTGIRYQDLTSGGIFSDVIKTQAIVQLGIQTLPGTKIYLNDPQAPIIIGPTGIYELDVDGLAYITQIKVDGRSLQTIESSQLGYIIFDFIYESGE